MARHQAQALGTTLGAYKATPIRSLELDTFCPPLDIYLNKRVADFELRMQLSGPSLQLDRGTAYVEARLRDWRKPLEGTHREWAKNWAGSTGHPDDCWDSKAAAARDWKARWTAQARTAPARADDTPAAEALEGGHLRLYEKLAKAEGSALCQVRTEKIGLQRFLFHRQVPGVVSTACPCGRGDQTVAHLFTECADARSKGLRAFGYVTEKDVHQGLSHHDTAPDMARALTQSGWLPQFRVFNGLQQTALATESDNHAWARRPLPQSIRRRTRALAMRHGLLSPDPVSFAPLPFPPPPLFFSSSSFSLFSLFLFLFLSFFLLFFLYLFLSFFFFPDLIHSAVSPHLA